MSGFVACLVVLEPFIAISSANSLILLMAIDSIVASSIMETTTLEIEKLREELKQLVEKENQREISRVQENAAIKQDISILKTDMGYLKTDIGEMKSMLSNHVKNSQEQAAKVNELNVDGRWQKDIWKYILGALTMLALGALQKFINLGK